MLYRRKAPSTYLAPDQVQPVTPEPPDQNQPVAPTSTSQIQPVAIDLTQPVITKQPDQNQPLRPIPAGQNPPVIENQPMIPEALDQNQQMILDQNQPAIPNQIVTPELLDQNQPATPAPLDLNLQVTSAPPDQNQPVTPIEPVTFECDQIIGYRDIDYLTALDVMESEQYLEEAFNFDDIRLYRRHGLLDNSMNSKHFTRKKRQVGCTGFSLHNPLIPTSDVCTFKLSLFWSYKLVSRTKNFNTYYQTR